MKQMIERHVPPLCGRLSPRFANGMTYVCNQPAGHREMGLGSDHQRWNFASPHVPTWDDDRSTDR